jgi:hypothetical protein
VLLLKKTATIGDVFSWPEGDMGGAPAPSVLAFRQLV